MTRRDVATDHGMGKEPPRRRSIPFLLAAAYNLNIPSDSVTLTK